VVVTKAKGCKVEDADGNEYLDFISMFAVMNMGHAHPKIVAAAVEQIQTVPLVNAAWIHPLYPKLADRLCKVRAAHDASLLWPRGHVLLTSGPEIRV
jgi:ornithine--oxo-acid transaminase